MHGFRNDAVDWSETNLTTLKTMWADGHSCSVISAKIPNSTRSAVIGKIYRLKLPRPAGKMARSGSYTARTRAPRPLAPSPAIDRPFLAPPAAPRLRNGHDPSQRRNPSHNIVAAIAIARTEPGLPENLKGEAPDGTGVKFLDLKDDSCRFPRGEVGTPSFEFCGAKALSGLPYCAHHTKTTMQSPQARVRVGVIPMVLL